MTAQIFTKLRIKNSKNLKSHSYIEALSGNCVAVLVTKFECSNAFSFRDMTFLKWFLNNFQKTWIYKISERLKFHTLKLGFAGAISRASILSCLQFWLLNLVKFRKRKKFKKTV